MPSEISTGVEKTRYRFRTKVREYVGGTLRSHVVTTNGSFRKFTHSSKRPTQIHGNLYVHRVWTANRTGISGSETLDLTALPRSCAGSTIDFTNHYVFFLAVRLNSHTFGASDGVTLGTVGVSNPYDLFDEDIGKGTDIVLKTGNYFWHFRPFLDQPESPELGSQDGQVVAANKNIRIGSKTSSGTFDYDIVIVAGVDVIP